MDGATNATFTAIVDGEYAVIATNGFCSATSDCELIDYTGVSENTAGNISLFSNPTNNFVTVTFSAAKATVTVYDAQGKLLQTTSVASGEQIALSNYETGVYFVQVATEFGTTLERVVKN